MDKNLKKVILLVTIMFVAGTVNINVKAKNKDCDLKFGVISDVHIRDDDTKQNEKFKCALNILKDFSKDHLNALVVAGDLTDCGQRASYDKFREIYDNILGKKVEKVFVMGNHEYYTGLSPMESQKRFTKRTGEKVNTKKIINGYSFITISTENAAVEGTFSGKSKQWLSEQLEESSKDSPQKPIFVIVHQPVKGTVYGSERECTDELYPILSKYPQVICFAGHSHYPLNDERCINQKDFTSVGTGTLKSVDFDENMINRTALKNKEISQGLFVEVNEKRVIITRIDFLNNRIIGSKWIIEEPCNKNNFKYTYARKLKRTCPRFKPDAKCNINIKEDNSAEIEFSKAYHDDFVHSYKIILINQDKDKVENEFMFISDFFINSDSDNFKIKLSNLNKGVNYKVQIKAVESFGNESGTDLHCEFKI